MHHARRKSGHGSSTDVRKTVSVSDNSSSRHKSSSRPSVTRKTTPQAANKLGKSPRSREREWEQEHWWEEERESFPQYCMSCEKQFIPQDDRFLYCSEDCRVHDQNHASAAATASRAYASPLSASASTPSTLYPYYSAANAESRDIIPRASPSRPSSMHYSPPSTPSQANPSSAISALRSLSIRDSSPPSPGGLMGTYHPNIWPFSSTASARGAAAASPGTSYTRPTSTVFSSTYDSPYYAVGAAAYGAPTLERPLPRRAGTYSRPKSIELVTPMVGR